MKLKKFAAIDIGSNDGTFLKGFKEAGMSVLGVEPTDIAKIAESGGIPTVQEFFSEKVAIEILKNYGNAIQLKINIKIWIKAKDIKIQSNIMPILLWNEPFL